MSHLTAEEIAPRLQALGMRRLTMRALQAEIAALGYKLNRDLDCRASSRFITGSLADTSYPCCAGYVVQSDDGLSFANVNARRDSNFRALQNLRGEVFAISRGAIFEL